MEKYTRVFSFMFEVFGMAGKNKTLLKPIWYNLAIAAPLNLGLAVAYGMIRNPTLQYVVLAVGVTALYFTDYFCNALTCSLIYDQVTTGNATMEKAMANTKRSAGGIITFAAISGLFDLLASYANERDDILGKIITRVVHAVWTTAVFVVMPAMVIEGLSFGAAFGRSKEIMKQDPTNVGTGVIGIGVANWVLGIVCMAIAYFGLGVLSNLHPIAGAAFFFTFFNLYWAVSGFLKISYFTCFYMWANECTKQKSADGKLAPAPLAAAMGYK
ncbi:MAG: hypothetical protein IT381_24230 [Deltaproteobacteria bacterium]|nr:hypothetical protein [Deltaproteobacteria bacterium]